jgi:hypothetical protein
MASTAMVLVLVLQLRWVLFTAGMLVLVAPPAWCPLLPATAVWLLPLLVLAALALSSGAPRRSICTVCSRLHTLGAACLLELLLLLVTAEAT